MSIFSIHRPENSRSSKPLSLALVLLVGLGIVMGLGGATPAAAQSGEPQENEDEIEYEPDPFMDPGHSWLKVEENEDEIEYEPDPFMSSGSKPSWTRHELLAELCRWTTRDDHGDSLTCASILPAGTIAEGALSAGDADMFELALDGRGGRGLRTLVIESVADVPITGELLDASGRRLARLAGSSEGQQLTRPLPAGVYFVKLTNPGDDGGVYALIWGTLP